MFFFNLRRLFVCLLGFVLLAGCAQPPVEAPAPILPPERPAIIRQPEPNTILAGWQEGRSDLELLTPNASGGLDLRSADVSGLSLHAFDWRGIDFDSVTKWPDTLPDGFDPQALTALGKDPGLGLRELHAQGITGEGIGIGIIDQTLLIDHSDYADRLRYYREYHGQQGTQASPRGTAVASMALGTQCGVAPGALLYYIAEDTGISDADGFVRDMRYCATAIDELLAYSRDLPTAERIRVISISASYLPETAGAVEFEAAVARARAEGVAVIWVSERDPLNSPFSGMGRDPLADPNAWESLTPARAVTDFLYTTRDPGDPETVLLPMDARTLAAPSGPNDFAYYSTGGPHWRAPYLAGLYALACQVQPEVSFEAFLKAAQQTARPLKMPYKGREIPYGSAIDPAALLAALEG